MAEGREIVVEGEVERVTFESEASGFRVVKVAVDGRADRLAVVGTFPRMSVGTRVRVRGSMTNDKKHGEQLQATQVTELSPTTIAGLEKYLASGAIQGVGAVYASRIVGAFGLDSLRVLDDEALAMAKLARVEGIGPKRAEKIAKAWASQKAVRDVMVFLQAHGASPALAVRIHRRYGADAVSVVSRDPYRLAVDIWGVGFKTADRIAEGLGVARDAPERFQAGVLQAVRDARDSGHAYVIEAQLIEQAAALLGVDATAAETAGAMTRAIQALAMSAHVVPENVQGTHILYDAEMYAAERRLARRLVEIARTEVTELAGAAAAIAEFESHADVALAPEQREAVESAARAPVLVVTGGPGVGKTTIVRAILAVLDRARLVVRLAAPTGRAAKRMSEATGREASTLHRLLEFDPKSATFKRDRNRPIEAGAVVVDEASMIDVDMADALTQALAPGTRLVVVGDVDQLASVGPGAVLRDVIASGEIACVRLTRIFRQAQASLIVTNAHRINAGEAPIAPETGDDRADFYVIDRRDPEAARKTIVELVTQRIPRRFGLDPVRDVQVLAPMHRGPCGSVALNEALQAALNPSGVEIVHGQRILRVGDKVMQLRNDYDKNVFNGDVGIIEGCDTDEDTVTVRFDADRAATYERGELDEITLAYACSVHKSQGSEYPAVVVPLLTSHFVMLSRNLLYTAVTRGRRLVVLVCDPRAVSLAVSEDRKDERRTRLAERIVEAAHAGGV